MERIVNTSQIIALIATCDRHDLLLRRSLPSVLNQTRLPNHIVIIDDSPSSNLKEKLKIPSSTKISYLRNNRTKGASGAWNTGLVHVLKNCTDAKNTFIAILDDDDFWDTNHLASCVEHVTNNDMVISGLIRYEDDKIFKDDIPSALDTNEILVSNPGIQGSNMFVRFSSLLEAGLFDENLTSCTDRDLCLRLADLGVRVASTNQYTVKHYACTNRARLSSYESSQKLNSLETFWRKYQGRMTVSQKELFLARSKSLFGFQPKGKSFHQSKHLNLPEALEPFSLIVGVISDSAEQLLPLLQDFSSIQNESFLSSVEVVVLENGGDGKLLAKIIKQANVNSRFISINQQINDSREQFFGRNFTRTDQKLGIGKARTVLQRYLYHFSRTDSNAIVWILDDDMRLGDKAKLYLPWLPVFRKLQIDVVLGFFEGASPNPPLNGIRVQLVDFINNLMWLDGLPSDDVLPDRSGENRDIRSKYSDYYYDLSRSHTAHLETICWITPAFEGETVAEARKRLVQRVEYLLAGESITRPLIVDLPTNPIAESCESVNRGGNTFILNPNALLTPNAIIEVSGKEARRSDMIWAIINRYYYGFTIKSVNFPVLHQRIHSKKPQLNIEKVVGEIQGSSIYAGLKEFFKGYASHSFDFNEKSENIICQKVHDCSVRRLEALKLSYFRARGIYKQIQAYDKTGELQELMHQLEQWFNEQVYEKIACGVKDLSNDKVIAFIHSLKNQASNYKNAYLKSPKLLNNWCHLPTHLGQFRMYDTGDENLRLVSYGDIHNMGDSPLIRIHSSCMASELFKSTDCDCADQLEEAMQRIASEKQGLIFHLQQEGRGQGLSHKIKAVSLMQKKDMDTVEAFEELHLKQDVREYQKVVDILLDLKIKSVRLITNNPRKKAFLQKAGIVVECVNTIPKIREENRDYLHTKKDKLNHSFNLD